MQTQQNEPTVRGRLNVQNPEVIRLKRQLSRARELISLVGCLLTPNQVASLGIDDRDLLSSVMEAENV